MLKILVKVSEPYSRPSLKPGTYVTVHICEQVDFCDLEVNENAPFRPIHSFSPMSLDQLRSYLLGLQHMAAVIGKEKEIVVEAPKELHILLLGIEKLREAITEVAA
jgi:hypothetical protein